jgi:hypothetical protein
MKGFMKHEQIIEWRHHETKDFKAVDVEFWLDNGILHFNFQDNEETVPFIDGQLCDALYAFENFLKAQGCSDGHYSDIVECIIETLTEAE